MRLCHAIMRLCHAIMQLCHAIMQLCHAIHFAILQFMDTTLPFYLPFCNSICHFCAIRYFRLTLAFKSHCVKMPFAKINVRQNRHSASQQTNFGRWQCFYFHGNSRILCFFQFSFLSSITNLYITTFHNVLYLNSTLYEC